MRGCFAWYLRSTMGVRASQFVPKHGCFADVMFVNCSPPPAVLMMSVHTYLGANWYSLLFCIKFTIKLVLKTATSSDELTYISTRHGRATPTSNTAKQPRFLQGVGKNNSYLRMFVCHSVDFLDTKNKMSI